MTLPTFLIIGAEKAGTSWLYQNFLVHPDVFVPKPPFKELHFFNKDVNWNRGLRWYESFFDGSDGKTAVGEVTPGYLPSREAPSRIKLVLPQVRIVGVLRDPVARAFSAHRMGMSKLHIYPMPFLQAIEEYPQLVRNSLYGQQAQEYLDVFSRDQCMFEIIERVMAAKEESISGILRFLGAPPMPDDVDLGRAHAPSRTVRFPWINSALLSSADLMRRLGFSKLLGIRNTGWLRQLVFELNSRKGRQHYSGPTPEERKVLIDRYFGEDMRILERVLGIDVGDWFH